MNDYSKMSDEDIACLVLKANGYTHSGSGNRCEVFVSETGKKYVGVSLNNQFKFDPCNSWADAGPIIAEHQISIIFDADSMIEPPAHWVMCRHVSSSGDVAEYYEQPNKPLRAAMIVLLMMKESK